MSEIDKIFAAKRIADPQPSIAPSKSKKKRKHKSTRPQSDAPGSDPPSDRKKRPEPETVVDPSSDINPKRQKLDRTNVPPKSKSKRSDKDDEKTFKDSRGSAARRTTEEGWLIYKEDELGIREDGGDTPLCPFDCDCCF
ncbi:hypothetical protein AX14_008164 [Amanita brunnescens Koide BX004]|nr:hypothetical protein AX14_008164 [Amanita brunnescens Koide BX004]